MGHACGIQRRPAGCVLGGQGRESVDNVRGFERSVELGVCVGVGGMRMRLTLCAPSPRPLCVLL